MVGHAALDRVIGVRIPASQPIYLSPDLSSDGWPPAPGSRPLPVPWSRSTHAVAVCLRETVNMTHNGAALTSQTNLGNGGDTPD